MNVLRKFVRLAPADRRLVVRAGLTVAAFRVALWVLPWQRVLARVGPSRSGGGPAAGVARLEWAVRAASRFVPGATCLTQALALGRLLARNGYEGIVQIGVARTPRFSAHAWIEYDGATLLDGGGAAEYARLVSWNISAPVHPR